MKQTARGFTLIELMVSVTIIAVLISIGLAGYTVVRKDARADRRAADLKDIVTALELYKAQNGQYPVTSGAWRSECSSWGGYSPNDVIPGLVPTFMQSFPKDPGMETGSNRNCYLYMSDGTDYKVLDHDVAEFSAADYLKRRDFMDPLRDGGSAACTVDGTAPWSWALYSSAVSACW